MGDQILSFSIIRKTATFELLETSEIPSANAMEEIQIQLTSPKNQFNRNN